MSSSVSQPWLAGEGDAWFQRNKDRLGMPEQIANDPCLKLIELHDLKPTQVCEIGTSSGWRLDALQRRYGCAVLGVDPSRMAIEYGRTRYPRVQLRCGTADDLWTPAVGAHALVIVAFVLHWAERDRLSASIAEIDRVVADGGHLLIADFLPDHPTKVRYHHRQDVEMWTWKQNYAECFRMLGTYESVEIVVFDHDDSTNKGPISSDRRACCTLLRKDLHGLYQESTCV